MTEEGFEFKVYAEHRDNQARYEAIGRVIDEEIYKLLETEGKLQRVPVRSLEIFVSFLKNIVSGWRRETSVLHLRQPGVV